MLFLIAFVGVAIIALVLWRTMTAPREDLPQAPRRPVTRPSQPRVSGPDDDPDFLRKLDEKVRRRDDPDTV